MDENYIDQLRALLKAAELSQKELAERLNVTPAALNRWLHGGATPHPKRRLAIAALYKTLIGFKPLAAAERTRLLIKARSLRQPALWDKISRSTPLLEELLLEHTYNSNAIEGSTLTKKETEAVIFDKSRLPDKSLVEHLEAVNHAAVLRDIFLKKYPSVITETLVRQIHRALLQGIRLDAGEYSAYHRAIRGVNIALTHPKDIPEEMHHLMTAWRQAVKRGMTIADVAQFHTIFELIHPFGDGNGRVGRLIMLIQLLSGDYPPVVIENSRKAEYYEVLEHAQRQSADPFLVFLVDEMEQTAVLLKKKRSR